MFSFSGLQDCSDDLMYARLMNMQMNADMSEQDRLIALSMTTPQTPPDFLDTDAQLAYQQQLEILVNCNYNNAVDVFMSVFIRVLLLVVLVKKHLKIDYRNNWIWKRR